MGPKNLIIAVVLAIALSAGIFLAVRMNPPAVPESAFVLPEPTELPAFSLVDQFGNAVNATTFRDHWDLVFFGFTHCPDICPATLQILASVKRSLAEQGHEPLPRIVLVSVDPERDTPELMGNYVDYFGDGNLGLTGGLDELTKLTSALGIYFEKREVGEDNYNVDHSAAVLLINPDGGFHALFGGPHVIENYVHDLPIIMASFKPAAPAPLVASSLEVTRPMPGMAMSAGYLALTNNTNAPIRISRVASAQFGAVELHETIVEDGIARMRQIPELVIPARDSVMLERGGKHLMLMRPTGTGETVKLQFFDGDTLLLDVSAGYR